MIQTNAKKAYLILGLTLLSVVLFGCSNEKTEQVLKQNATGLYESMLLEEEDKIMSYFQRNSDGYYEYYENIAYNIEHFNFNYKIEGMDLIKQSRKSYTMKVVVTVSGVDKTDETYNYQNLETMEWVKTDDGWKIDTYTTEFMK